MYIRNIYFLYIVTFKGITFTQVYIYNIGMAGKLC